ncbi:unnamed protein product [Brassica rapa]|uniref:Secreted protein n=1 Tax=Brassica campestris TaxID=3711 RepID=A0A8D9GAQ1_BRACM|nr:unnamed protein product [Brassica rapa]
MVFLTLGAFILDRVVVVAPIRASCLRCVLVEARSSFPATTFHAMKLDDVLANTCSL